VYLASKKIDGKLHYVIRESYAEEGVFLSRDLVDLGPDPGCHIVYPGGNAFYIHETIEDRLIEQGAGSSLNQLDDIFWRFVKPEIRRVLEPFRRRENRHRLGRKRETPEINGNRLPHIFDRRRVCYLKFGQSDQRNIGRMPRKLFRGLRDKSRDEIEQRFMDMEGGLNPREYKIYTYTIFDLQKYFYESFANSNPQMLSQDKVDEHFIEQVCQLNLDSVFWAGMATADRLHDYLIRYVLMHFDYDYGPATFLEDYLRQFINSHREYRPPYRNTAAGLKEASTILGESRATLRKMSSQELTRLYRRKAQELHPDKGGEQDKFVRLTEAYRNLVKSKKQGG
jgi:hypothetical protein